MSRLKDNVAAEELPAEDSGYLMGWSGSVSKPEANGVGSLEAKKEQCSSPAAAAAAEVNKEKEFSFLKIGVGDLSSEGFEGTASVSESVVDSRGVLDGSSAVVERDADFSCTNNVGSGAGKRGRERGTINLNADVNVEGMGLGRWNGERLEDQDHGFRVGDLVWGKIKSHPWWPGQVYDPRDASEFALKHSQEGRVLVAFFGDGSCSWCLPSQLVPFVDNLEKMLSDRPSRSFANAVQKAVDEIGRLVESRITCRCIPLEKTGHLARPKVANVGVKAEVLVPEVDTDRFPIPQYEPAEIHTKVIGFAKTASFDSLFELAILRSWISAYSYAECGRRLAVYSEPLVIEGLEENDDKKTVAIEGPLDDKIYYRRKQKSVAELMAKKVFKSKKTWKRGDGEVANGGGKRGSSSGKWGRDIRDRVSKSADTSDGLSDDTLVIKQENEIEAKTGSLTRERKKSKYLSPPYTSLKGLVVDSGYKLEAELDHLRKVDTIRKNMKDQESNAFAFLEELDDKASENDKMTLLASNVDLEVSELLLKLESAAVGCFNLRNEGYLDPIRTFVSTYRNSTYLRGSHYKMYQKCKKVSHKRKKPSLASPLGCTPKVSLPHKRPADKPTDDLVSDIRVIWQKVDTMTKILESHSSKFSSHDKTRLKDEMKRLMEKVVTAGDKVRLMAEKTSP